MPLTVVSNLTKMSENFETYIFDGNLVKQRDTFWHVFVKTKGVTVKFLIVWKHFVNNIWC